MKRFLAMLMLVSGLLVAGGALASAILTMTESNGDIVAAVSGTINTSGLSSQGTGSFGNGLVSGQAYLNFTTNTCDRYTGISGPATFGGPNSFQQTSSPTGDQFFVDGSSQFLCLPLGYNGGALAGTATISGVTFSGLGMIPGTYTYTWGSGPNADSLIVYIGVSPTPTPSAVPTLSEWAQLMLALMVIGIAWHFHNNRQNSY